MTKRNSGIDVLRILSMVGIVSLHVIGLGGGEELIPEGTLSNIIVRYIWIISFISVDVFGILTGYLNCNKKHCIGIVFWIYLLLSPFGALLLLLSFAYIRADCWQAGKIIWSRFSRR